jgi:hypothetical protein
MRRKSSERAELFVRLGQFSGIAQDQVEIGAIVSGSVTRLP